MHDVAKALEAGGTGGAAWRDAEGDLLLQTPDGWVSFPAVTAQRLRYDPALVSALRHLTPLHLVAADLSSAEAAALAVAPRRARVAAAARIAEPAARRSGERLRRLRRGRFRVGDSVPSEEAAWEALPEGSLVRGELVAGFWPLFVHLPDAPRSNRRRDWWGPFGRKSWSNTFERPWEHPIMRRAELVATGVSLADVEAEARRLTPPELEHE